jgi:hypothetical protein
MVQVLQLFDLEGSVTLWYFSRGNRTQIREDATLFAILADEKKHGFSETCFIFSFS